MKLSSLLIMLLLIQPVALFSQTTKIVKILNQELEREVRAQKEDSLNYPGETFEIVKNYNIENNVLSVTVRKKSVHDDSYYTERLETDLRKITGIVKDINVIFETEPGSVKVTRTEANGRTTTHKTELFFLQLSYEKGNIHLADMLVKAFRKAGVQIENRFWHD